MREPVMGHPSFIANTYLNDCVSIRRPVCAGSVYPAHPEELRTFLRDAFGKNRSQEILANSGCAKNSTTDSTNLPERNIGVSGVAACLATNEEPIHPSSEGNTTRIRALLAPHIDYRVSLDAYIAAFRPLADLRPRRVVVLATSHYSGMFYPAYDGKPFILTRRCFQTPLGIVPVDGQAVDVLAQHATEAGISMRDMAHRNEHSIELHLIMLQYIWRHRFLLVPVLVGPLDDLFYVPGGRLAQKVQAMASLLRGLFAEDEQTLFLVSGDLSHFGRKFGDEFCASDCFTEALESDSKFLGAAASGNPDTLLSHVGDNADAWRICGFPPLYTALRTLSPIRGEITGHSLWDERNEESAVTFGSILFR